MARSSRCRYLFMGAPGVSLRSSLESLVIILKDLFGVDT